MDEDIIYLNEAKDDPRFDEQETPSDRHLYKYMDMETAILCLKNGTLRFAEPSTWKDPTERYIYGADIRTEGADKIPRVYACCVTTNQLSEASWITYSYGKLGLGRRCVKFSLKVNDLRRELELCAYRKGYKIYEGVVEYVTNNELEDLGRLNSGTYGKYISIQPFTDESFLKLLLLKRKAFYYENEHRFFITKRDEKEERSIGEGQHIDLDINWQTVIDCIYYAPDCTPAEIEAFKKFTVGLGIQKSTLYNERERLIIP